MDMKFRVHDVTKLFWGSEPETEVSVRFVDTSFRVMTTPKNT